ncbi:DUF397 domain-containing protein [Amycolatopsis nigrescens]|uniref:DUF397 domain-containing protein n=1 Tax=Amycolatopsis nigrescens TaxID=381445 RepID=UPI0003A460A4|nr:DUF397 domain-containing protein [Amycolatopsis nigrescens]
MEIESSGLRWVKSSASDEKADDGDCVEIAMTPARVLVRDSKSPGPRLDFAPSVWSAFLTVCARQDRQEH